MRTHDAPRQSILLGYGSIAAAQASVGFAATCPTTGTILITADPTRHGAAANPQLLKANKVSNTATLAGREQRNRRRHVKAGEKPL